MQTSAEIPEQKAVWLKKRRTTRRALLGFTLLFTAFFASGLWLFEQDYQQWLQEATQYQQDCSHATAASPNCQLLSMQVYEHRKEGSLDPDADTHLWIGLQSKYAPKFMVDTSGSQWDRLGIGSPVTATVWNGEVQEVRDRGGAEMMATNPIRKSKDKRLSLTGLELLALVALFITPLAFISADKLHKRYWLQKSGNNTAP